MSKAITKKSALVRTARRLATIGLIAGLSTSVVGCSAITDIIASSADSNATAYGAAIGSGEIITSETGTYEKLTLPKNSPLYTVAEYGGPPIFNDKDMAAGQKLAMDYIVNEMLDSKALEGGDAGYQSWVETTAPTYFDQNIIPKLAPSEHANSIVFGNIGGSNSIPKLINDGKPRLNNVDAKVTGYSIEETPLAAMKFTVEFSGDYRVSDRAAAEFSAFHLGVTPEEFLASDKATEAVKDGVGENIHRTTGTAEVIIGWVGDLSTINYDPATDLKIMYYTMKADFDYSSYTQNLES